MTRTLAAAVLTEIAKPAVVTKVLVEVHLSTIVYMTDHARSIEWDGNTYLSGEYINAESVRESAEIRGGGFNLVLTGVTTTFRTLLLAGGNMDRQVIIRRIFLDSSEALINDPVIVADGRISGYRIKEDLTSSTVAIELASHWIDFDKVVGRRTNLRSQQLHFPNDTGMQYAADSAKDILWAREY